MKRFRSDANLASTDQTGVSKPHATSGGARGATTPSDAGDEACATGEGAGASTSIACGAWTAGGACATGEGPPAAANIRGSKDDGRDGSRSISSPDEESDAWPSTGTRRQRAAALPRARPKTYSGLRLSTSETPFRNALPFSHSSWKPGSLSTIHSQMSSMLTPSCASCAASSGDANADATAASYFFPAGRPRPSRRRAGARPAVVCAAASWTLASSWARLAVLASACPEIKLLRDDFNVNRRHLDHHTGVDPRRLQLRATARLPQISLLLKVFDAPRGFLGRGLRVALDLRRRGEEPFGGQDGQRRRGVELDQLRFLIVRGLLGRREQRVQAEERRPAWRSTSELR